MGGRLGREDEGRYADKQSGIIRRQNSMRGGRGKRDQETSEERDRTKKESSGEGEANCRLCVAAWHAKAMKDWPEKMCKQESMGRWALA